MKTLLIATFLFTASCSQNNFVEKYDSIAKRKVANSSSIPSDLDPSKDWIQDLIQENQKIGGSLNFPLGVKGKDMADLWHLNEGSDFYPVKWLYHLKSFTTKIKGTMFLEKLDEKFGVVADPYSSEYGYPLKWIGLSTAWTDENPKSSDALTTNGDVTRVKWKGDLPQIAVMGVNCAFCHTSQVKEIDFKEGYPHKMKAVTLDGAPSITFIRGFFQDLMVSTLKTMLIPEHLEEFLKANGHIGNHKLVAQKFSADFREELELPELGFKEKIVKKLLPKTFDAKSIATFKAAIFKNRDIVTDYLTHLVRLTYQIGEAEVPSELKFRLQRMAIIVGADPHLATTPEGYSRTDAFGRISNLVARIDNPTELTATTSVPHMWGIQYKSLFHWNANTNSVMNRNVGQSFGLGAVLTNPSADGKEGHDSTSNLHNLARLEKLLYKLKVPSYKETFGVHPMDSRDSLQKGCDTFVQKCMNCHQSDERVGPKGMLIHDKMVAHDDINTDRWYSELQSTPIKAADGRETAFKQALFDFVNNVKERYYERYNVSEKEIISWQSKDLRGEERFRDTFKGENSRTGDNSYLNLPKKLSGYPARSLAGAWATAPYLHNGSVPSMAVLLTPESRRPKRFFVGSNVFDAKEIGFKYDYSAFPGGKKSIKAEYNKTFKSRKALQSANANGTYENSLMDFACKAYPARCFDTAHKGNTNKGHSGESYGTNLSNDKKKDLISFLKYVRPHIEYSWKAKPIYRIVQRGSQKSCELY